MVNILSGIFLFQQDVALIEHDKVNVANLDVILIEEMNQSTQRADQNMWVFMRIFQIFRVLFKSCASHKHVEPQLRIFEISGNS